MYSRVPLCRGGRVKDFFGKYVREEQERQREIKSKKKPKTGR